VTTQTAARDAIIDTLRDAWLADPITVGIELQYDNVKADPPGEDAAGNALPFARITVRHQISPQETIGGVGNRKHLTEGLVTVQVFTASGDGHTLPDQIAEILKAAMRNVRVGDLWFFDVRVNEIGTDGPWFNQNVLGNFRYEERS